MTTPIVDFLENYEKTTSSRLHMPGHKGKFWIHPLSECHLMDITEVKGADSLYEAEGIIAESEKNASEVFRTYKTFYSAGGSTLGIQTMLSAVVGEKGRIISARNAHRAFVNTCALSDADVIWVTGENADVISSMVKPSDIENALKENKADAVYITSPDYYGNIADIKGISEVCKKYGVPLIVDNAHGSHLAFLEESQHPIALGADICCDSAHKTLPVLTGGAYIHTASEKYAKKIKAYQSVFGSSSPSYLILASLDHCNFMLCGDSGKRLLKSQIELMENLKERLSPTWSFTGDDVLHLTVEAYKSGLSGEELAERLRENGIECEYADEYYTVLLFSLMNDYEDYDRLIEVMENIPQPRILLHKDEMPYVLPKKAMSIREATFKESEKISVDNAEGRISALNVSHCPPCIPIVVAGEVIDKNSVNILKRYSIYEINVVK